MRECRYWLGDDLTLATTELGCQERAEHTLIFLHGWLDNSASFHRMMYSLNQRFPRWHLVALDLPGHGLSAHKGPGNYYPFHDYIYDLHRFLRVLSPNKPVLVGHSLGALIASCYSAAFGEQVAGLIQIEGAGPLAESPELATTRLKKGIQSRVRLSQKPQRSLGSFDEALRLRASVTSLPAALIAPVVARDTRYDKGLEGWRWRHDSRLKCDSLYRMTLEQADTLRGDIDCPHRVILGSQGYSALIKQSQQFEHVVHVPGGHHCHLESLLQVQAVIVDLVNKI